MNLKEINKERKHNRNKALAFVIPVCLVVIGIYYWVMVHIRIDGQAIGMTWELQLIFGAMAFIVMKQFIFKGILKQTVEITKRLAKGESFKDMVNGNIEEMTDEEWEEYKNKGKNK